MKKILLSILCLVAVALTGYAAEVTFDFTNPTGLNPSITPAASQGVDVSDQTFTNGDFSITATKGSSTDARIWTKTNGTYEMRVYKGATITIKSATDPITKITFDGSTLAGVTTADGTTAEEEWTGSANEVVYTVADNSGTVYINQIVVSTDKMLDCELTWVSPFIQANKSSCKINFNSPLGNSGANYWATYDGTEPHESNAAAKKIYPSALFQIYSCACDTVVNVKVRAEKDGVYGKTLEGTFYFSYATDLTAYKAVNTMAAGNYVMILEDAIARRVDEKANYGELPTVAATTANGLVSAYSYFEWTFEATNGGYYIKDSYGRYLYMNGTYNNFNVTSNVPTAGGVWTVDINADGTAKIMNVDKQKYIQCYETGGVKTIGSFNTDKGTMPKLAAKHELSVVMTPAEGSTVDALDKLTFYCADGIVAASNIKYVAVMTNNATITGTAKQIDDNTVEYVLNEAITAPGTYDIRVYQKAFTLAPNSSAQAWPSVMQTPQITVGGAVAPVELVVTPENNSTQESLQNFTFSCSAGIYPNELFGGQAPFLGYTDPKTGASSQIALEITAGTETSVTLSTETAQTTEGYYTLVVPAEYFVLGGSKPNEAIMNQYMVQAASTEDKGFKFTGVTPEEGVVTELSRIIVVPEVELNNSPSGWTLTDAEGNSYAIETSVPSDYKSINVIVEETITAPGTYTLNIPAGNLIEYQGQGRKNAAASFTWTIEAKPTYIELLEVKPAEGPVTSLKEIQVITDTDLATGVNGAKLTDANGTEYPINSATNNREGDDEIYESIIITVQSEITAEGTYTLTIPAGAVKQYGGTKVNAEKTYTWTIEAAVEEPDYIFNADDYEVAAEFTTLTDGIFTFLQGEGSTKTWIVDASDKNYSNGVSTTKRIKPQTAKNYLTADIPAAGKLVFGVHSSSSNATDRTLSVKQNNVELYGQIVSEADKVDGVHKVHEVAVEAGLATITMPVNTLNFSYIEFVPGGEQEEGIKATWSMEEGAVVESFESVTLTFEGEGIETAKALYDTHYIFYEKDAEGNYNLTTPNPGFQSNGYLDFKTSGTTITFSVDPELFSSDYTSPFARKGDYRLVVPVGGIYFNDDKTNLNTKEYVLNFTIDNDIVELEEIDAKFTADPEINSTVSEIREITLTFNDYESVTVAEPDLNMGTNIPTASMVDPEFGFASPVGYVMFRPGEAANQITFYVDPTFAGVDAFTVEGDYEINVPSRVVTFSDGVNKAFTLKYTVKAGAVEEGIKATWSMEEGAVVESFESVTLTFEGEGIETAKALYDTHYIFYEKDAEGNYNLTTPNPGFQSNGYLDFKTSGTTITFSVDPELFSSDYTSPFARKGDYRLVVPVGGIYFNDDKTNLNTEEYVLNFTIDNDIVELEEIDAKFTADPEINSTVSEIREITLTFDDYKSVTVAEPDLNMGTNIPTASMVDPEFGFASPVGYVMFRPGKAANQITFYVDPMFAGVDAFTVEGDYEINVPSRVVTFSDGVNKAFTLKYTVKAGVVESTEVKFLSVNPTEGVVESISFIQVITDTDLGMVSGCTLTDANGNEYEIEQTPENKDESDPNYESIIIVPFEEITAAGTYTLTIPAGAVIEFITDMNITPKTNTETVSYTWTIEAAPEPLALVSSNPAEGATVTETLESILTTWNKNVDLTFSQTAVCYIEDAEGNKITNASGAWVFVEGVCQDNQIEFVLSNPITTAQGVHTLVIGAGNIYDMATGTENEEVRISFNLNINKEGGINGIKADAENGYVVYDLNGYRIMQTRNVADLYRLENGIYIINGVKVLLNK